MSDEERALWSGLVRAIKPLHQPKRSAASPAGEQRPAAGKLTDIAPRAKPLPLARVGRRFKRRVVRGNEPIDARIDLHGLTQSQAHPALLMFLERAQASRAKLVLIVTGKGASRPEGVPAIERGVLRRQVPIWLSLPQFRSFVSGFEHAHFSHGGEGALYVRLRRR